MFPTPVSLLRSAPLIALGAGLLAACAASQGRVDLGTSARTPLASLDSAQYCAYLNGAWDYYWQTWASDCLRYSMEQALLSGAEVSSTCQASFDSCVADVPPPGERDAFDCEDPDELAGMSLFPDTCDLTIGDVESWMNERLLLTADLQRAGCDAQVSLEELDALESAIDGVVERADASYTGCE